MILLASLMNMVILSGAIYPNKTCMLPLAPIELAQKKTLPPDAVPFADSLRISFPSNSMQHRVQNFLSIVK